MSLNSLRILQSNGNKKTIYNIRKFYGLPSTQKQKNISIQKISYIIILSLGLLPIASCNRIKNKIKSIEYSMHEGAIYIDMG